MIQKWTSDVLNSSETLAIPLMTYPGIEWIGARVKEVVTDGETHFKAIQALHQHSRSAAVTMAMDLTVEAKAFGCKIHFETNDIPAVAERLIHTMDKVHDLQVPDLSSSGRLREYLKAAELAVKNIRDVPVFPGCIGPFSLAGRLIDMTEIMTGVYTDPEHVHVLLKKSTSFLKKSIGAYKALGVHGVIMAEPVAGLLGEEECDRFSSSYIKTIVEELQDADFMIILHNCGHQGNLAKSMESTGAKALHFGNSADMSQVLRTVNENILVMGNIDPVNVLQTKDPGFVRKEVRKLLQTAEGYSNFVLSSGCDMPPGVPRENIAAFFEALEEWNQHLPG